MVQWPDWSGRGFLAQYITESIVYHDDEDDDDIEDHSAAESENSLGEFDSDAFHDAISASSSAIDSTRSNNNNNNNNTATTATSLLSGTMGPATATGMGGLHDSSSFFFDAAMSSPTTTTTNDESIQQLPDDAMPMDFYQSSGFLNHPMLSMDSMDSSFWDTMGSGGGDAFAINNNNNIVASSSSSSTSSPFLSNLAPASGAGAANTTSGTTSTNMMMMMSSSFGNQSMPALNFSDFEDSTDDDMEKDDEELNKYSNTKDQPDKDHTESSFGTELLIGAALGMGSMGVAHALTKAVEGMISNDDVGMGDVADSWGSMMLLDPSSATSAASKVVSQEATNQLLHQSSQQILHESVRNLSTTVITTPGSTSTTAAAAATSASSSTPATAVSATAATTTTTTKAAIGTTYVICPFHHPFLFLFYTW
jgi:hypothetical protein